MDSDSQFAGAHCRCLKVPGSATFHPVKLVHGLAEAFVSAGGRLFEQTHLESQSLGGQKVTTAIQYVIQ